ncbi:MAG: hypothetical protein EAZ41_01895 [Sphingobacteriia bacterium]|nr:MAG: hypothetical protein EAZ41_01895 [Sphingobacteriia bacterium]
MIKPKKILRNNTIVAKLLIAHHYSHIMKEQSYFYLLLLIWQVSIFIFRFVKKPAITATFIFLPSKT